MSSSSFDARMRTRLPPHVTRETSRHGRVVHYFRMGKGARVRLPAFGTPEFLPAYRAALAGTPLPAPRGARPQLGTLAWAVTEYKASLHFRGLNPVTQRRRDAVFQKLVAASGTVPLERITERHIIDNREQRTHGKGHAANTFLKAIKPLFKYARERGWIGTDPTRQVDYVQPQAGTRLAWTLDDVARFEAVHPLGTMANLAMRILLFTGLRRSDAILLGRQHVRDGVVRFRPGKTARSSGVTVTFTALPPLLEAIAASKVGDLTFLVTEKGRPFASGASFGNWFEDQCKLAKVAARAHGLRKLGPTLAAEAGASSQELMAMWGWTTLAQAELYTRSADRERLGTTAAGKLMAAWTEQKANNTTRTLDQGAGTGRKSE